MKYLVYVAWFDCIVFESFCLLCVRILLTQETFAGKVVSEHLNEIGHKLARPVDVYCMW